MRNPNINVLGFTSSMGLLWNKSVSTWRSRIEHWKEAGPSALLKLHPLSEAYGVFPASPINLHPQYIVDDKLNKQSVIIPYDEWEKIVEAMEKLEDIQAYDKAKTLNDEVILKEA